MLIKLPVLAYALNLKFIKTKVSAQNTLAKSTENKMEISQRGESYGLWIEIADMSAAAKVYFRLEKKATRKIAPAIKKSKN